MRCHLIVIGLMGTGKTTLGRVLAARLALPLRDSDAAIERETGRTVRELAAIEGHDAMHEREAESLLEALAEPTRTVICAAASTIEREECRVALRRAFVVWLHADPDIVAGRFGPGDHRPRFGLQPADLLERQVRQRSALFAAVADLSLDGAEDPQVNADRVVAALSDR